MKKLTFSNGDKMPSLGLGTWKSKPGEVSAAVSHAVNCGYRHLDCAPIYKNEKEVGTGIKEGLRKAGIKREDLWITSKLWNTEHEEKRVIPALKQSLSDLRVDHLDLFLIHWPVALKPGTVFPEKPSDFMSLDNVPLKETWEGMKQAVKEGLAKHIGVSNFNIQNLKAVHDEEHPVEMNQVELHPYLQQRELVTYCRERSIFTTAYSPLGSRDRSSKLKTADEPVLMEDIVVMRIAKQKNTSPALVLIAWSLQSGHAVIPKSVTPEHIESNLKADNLRLTDAEMHELNKLDRDFRYVDGSFWTPEGSPYSREFLWGK